MNNIITPFFVPIKISQVVLDYARKFAAEQTTAEKAKKVYENTVAVGAVASYLHWMEFKTDLSQGESWNAASRYFNDVADLVLPEIGSIECRSLLPGETAIYLPPEATENRIGCVFVQLEEEADKVKILGFVPADNEGNLPEVVKVEDLQSLEELTELLGELEFQPKAVTKPTIDIETVAATVVETVAETVADNVEKLSQWFGNNFGQGWQPLAAAYRSIRVKESDSNLAVSRAKIIDFGVRVAGEAVALIVRLTPNENGTVDVLLRVFPADKSNYLPSGLELKVLDENGEEISEPVIARSADNWLQMELEEGAPDTRFSVTLSLGDATVTEHFVL